MEFKSAVSCRESLKKVGCERISQQCRGSAIQVLDRSDLLSRDITTEEFGLDPVECDQNAVTSCIPR